MYRYILYVRESNTIQILFKAILEMLNTDGKGMSRATQKRRKMIEKSLQVKLRRLEEVEDNEVVCEDDGNDVTDDDNKLPSLANTNFSSNLYNDNSVLEPLHFDRFQNILSHLNANVANTYPEIATSLLYFMIDPGTPEAFYKTYWGRKLYHSNHKKHSHFKGIISRIDIETAIKTHSLLYNNDVVVSSSKQADSILSGLKLDEEELNKTEIRHNNLWQKFDEGESICWLTSSQYNENIWKILSLLELEFEAVVNCQVYLLSPNGIFLLIYRSHAIFK